MERIYFLWLTVLLLITSSVCPAYAQMRTFNSPNYPGRKLAKQFNAGTESFVTVNPDPDGTPLTLTSATGLVGPNGTVTLGFLGGFTPAITITVFLWHTDAGAWVRLGPNNSGADRYSISVDSHYTLCQFSAPEGTPFLVMSSAGVTGFCYTDAKAHPQNANTAP